MKAADELLEHSAACVIEHTVLPSLDGMHGGICSVSEVRCQRPNGRRQKVIIKGCVILVPQIQGVRISPFKSLILPDKRETRASVSAVLTWMDRNNLGQGVACGPVAAGTDDWSQDDHR